MRAVSGMGWVAVLIVSIVHCVFLFHRIIPPDQFDRCIGCDTLLHLPDKDIHSSVFSILPLGSGTVRCLGGKVARVYRGSVRDNRPLCSYRIP